MKNTSQSISKFDIVNMAFEVYKTFGVSRISIDELVLEIGISKSRFYQLFRNKQDIVEHVIDLHIEHVKECISPEKLDEGDVLDCIILMYKKLMAALEGLNPVFYHDVRKYFPSAYSRLVDFRETHFFNRMKRIFKRGVEDSMFSETISTEMFLLGQLSYYAIFMRETNPLKSFSSISSTDLFGF